MNATKNICGFKNIYLTESLQEAISILNKCKIKLLILDLKLKDGSGLEILKMLKEKQIKVDVFIFSISKELSTTCFKYGAKAFYDKAKDFDKLIDAIKGLH